MKSPSSSGCSGRDYVVKRETCLSTTLVHHSPSDATSPLHPHHHPPPPPPPPPHRVLTAQLPNCVPCVIFKKKLHPALTLDIDHHSMQQGSHISMSSSSHSFSVLKTRRRNDSGELDVFDASLYFSGRVDDVVNHVRRVDRRRSLDASLGAMLAHKEQQKADDATQFKERTKKSKQPSSPGGMLASFLNSLFHQTSAKKKSKSSSISASSFVKDDECKEKRSKGRRRSIALPERVDDDVKGDSPHAQNISGGQRRCSLGGSTGGHKINQQDPFWSERSEACTVNRPFHNGANRWVLHGSRNYNIVYHKDPLWAEVFMRKEECCHGRREEEEGGDQRSESSSDLFELKNCVIGGGHLSSSGLPVYETAELCALNRETAIAF